MSDITILDTSFNEILTTVGYPLLGIEDLEYSREDIEQYFIFPAMKEYFRWFPIQEDNMYSVSGSFSLDFPDENTFGVIDARLVTLPVGSARTTNPFYNEILYNRSSSRGYYGTTNNYDLTEARIIKRMERQSFINSGKAFRVKINKPLRKLQGYSNLTGQVSVTWAKYSTDYSDIPFMHEEWVKKLSQANLLIGLSMIRGQQNSGLDVEFNYQLFLDKAEELKEEIFNKFKTHSKIILMRG